MGEAENKVDSTQKFDAGQIDFNKLLVFITGITTKMAERDTQILGAISALTAAVASLSPVILTMQSTVNEHTTMESERQSVNQNLRMHKATIVGIGATIFSWIMVTVIICLIWGMQTGILGTKEVMEVIESLFKPVALVAVGGIFGERIVEKFFNVKISKEPSAP